MKIIPRILLALLVSAATVPAPAAPKHKTPASPASTAVTSEDIASLRQALAEQQRQIEELRQELRRRDAARQQDQQALNQADSPAAANFIQPAAAETPSAQGDDRIAKLEADLANLKSNMTNAALTTQEDQKRVGTAEGLLSDAVKNLGGFRFSGDFRYRLDMQLRSGNAIAAPLQNIRSRYRLRLNVDKELDRRFRFHVQLSTGPINNGLTNDQDFAGTIAKQPFSIAEAYVDFHPHPRFSLRGGRMEEVFADNMRFLWDDDVRFNGFHQIIAVPLGGSFLGLKSIELRAGEYLLSNPNVVILSSSSPFVRAGFQPGGKVRDSNLFHPGFVVKGDLGKSWAHQFTSGIQLYRNPNQIQLASLADGFPVLVSNALGIALAGPMTGTGNATTTSGGAIYSARNFQIVHVAYRLDHKGWLLRGRELPAWLDFQASRNTGTGKLRDAFMISANAGAVRGLGDVRFLYQFAIKDANALISQFTDDDLGTGSGVNIAVHALRFDVGLTRFLQWQNLLFIQNERRANNPAEQFFVPLQRGANTTFRYLGQLAFSF